MIIILISACSYKSEENAFGRVVNYYGNNNETLKEKAAEYLRNNAEWHFGIPRHMSSQPEKNFNDFLFGIESNKDSVFNAYLDSCNIYMTVSDTVWDIESVTDDFLKENIELAFDSWSKPWSSNVDFHDFCKYILPYRNGDEELSCWRRFFKERYESTITDSVADPTSMNDVIEYLMRQIRRDVEYGGSMGPFCNELTTPEEMLNLHWLECMGCAHYTTLAMRACGIPCAMIEIHWRFTEVTHYSVLFPAVGDNERAFRLTVGDTLMYMGEPKDTMAAWRVWEYDYESNQSRKVIHELYCNNALISEFYHNPISLSDVTSTMCKTFDLSFPVPDSLAKEKYLFLCRFHDHQWLPIREGIVKDNNVYFSNATIRQWYRLGFADGDSVKTFGNTFTVSGDKSIKKINDRIQLFNHTGDSILFRIAYRDNVTDTLLRRRMTTSYWDTDNSWKNYTGEAILWGFNPETGEYHEFNDSTRKLGFKPDFHLLDIRMPCWTVFYDEILGSPFGFIDYNHTTNEGYLMQF